MHRAGAPSLDHLKPQPNCTTRNQLEVQLKLDLSKPSMIVAYHPVTIKGTIPPMKPPPYLQHIAREVSNSCLLSQCGCREPVADGAKPQVLGSAG